MAYDVGVRNYLTSKGISGTDIGYDKPSGNVTIKGKNFYKPELNMSGSTYSNQSNLDNAYKAYTTPKPVIMPDGSTGMMGGQQGINTVEAPKTQMSATSTTTPSKPDTPQYTNPYTSQMMEIFKHLSDKSAEMEQPKDIYSTPEYAAAKANQDKEAHQSTRAAQESMGASGFGRSTNLSDRVQGIQNDANDYLQTQLVPQIQNALEAKDQQAYNNLLNQYNMIYQLVNREDTLHQQDIGNAYNDKVFDAGRQDAATAATGIYNPSGLSYQEVQDQMNKNSAAYATATPDEQKRLHDENIQLGSQLGKTFDPGSGTYSEGQGFVGTKTIQAKQLDSTLNEVAYQHARDSLLDARYETEFNNNIKQQGFENALKIALQKHQISNDNAQIAISQQNANTSSSNSAWARDPNNPDNIYKSLQIDELKNPKPEGNTPELNGELDGLYTGITTGQITASSAIEEINGKVKAGLLTQADADQMLKLITTISTSQPNVRPKLTQDQIDANGGSDPQILNESQLDQLYKTDPTGKAAGRPRIDWAMWYTDPRGKVGGVSYDAWKQAYGPQLKAR